MKYDCKTFGASLSLDDNFYYMGGSNTTRYILHLSAWRHMIVKGCHQGASSETRLFVQQFFQNKGNENTEVLHRRSFMRGIPWITGEFSANRATNVHDATSSCESRLQGWQPMPLIDNALSLLNFRSTFTATIKNRINHSMLYWSCNCQCKGVIRPCDKTVLHNITVLIIIMCNFVALDSWTLVWLGIWTTIHLCNECHQTSNIRRTKFLVLNVSRLVLQLPLPSPLKPGV